MRKLIMSAGVLVLTVASALPSSANECFDRPLCERINGDIDVFVGKVLTDIDDDAAVRVRVIRSFKGSAKGDIPIVVFPIGDLGFPDYEIGESYLFFASKSTDDVGVTRRRAGGCGGASKLKDVSREELNFLENLGHSGTGQVYGEVMRESLTERAVPDLRIVLKGRGKEYSATTDNDGKFRIAGMLPGTYKFDGDGPKDLLLLVDETEITISPNGCYEASIVARHNATITGRVTLPTGFDVDHMPVHAFTLDGREAAEAFADKDGHYEIVGITPGDYVLGVNAGRFPPGPERPFPPTYAPAEGDRAKALRVHIDTGSRAADVNIFVNAASQVMSIPLRATFDDGQPVDEATFSFSFGGGRFGGARIENGGTATLRMVRGVRTTLVGGGRTKEGNGKCILPLVLGPDDYPERLELTLSEDACRVQSNIDYLANFERGNKEPFESLLVVALYPNGTPVYRAEVFVSQPPHFFTGGFQADAQGRVEVPAPLDGEISIHAGTMPLRVFPNPPPRCDSPDVVVTREHVTRWRYRSEPSTWHDASEPIILHLDGPDCRH